MKAFKTLTAVPVVAAVCLVASGVWATVLYQTDFEAAAPPAPAYVDTDGTTFTPGDLIKNKPNWGNSNDQAVITNNQSDQGSQALQLNPTALVDRTISGAPENQVIWIEAYFKGPGSDAATPTYPADPPASSIVHFSKTNGIQMYDGTGTTWIQAKDPYKAINQDLWYQITLRQDYIQKKWDCFVDGVKQNDNVLGFRDGTVTKLNGFMNLSDTVSYLDHLVVIQAEQGDANGDSQIDSADVVRAIMIAAQPAPALSLIWGGNADVTGTGGNPDGVVNDLDVQGIADKVLGI